MIAWYSPVVEEWFPVADLTIGFYSILRQSPGVTQQLRHHRNHIQFQESEVVLHIRLTRPRPVDEVVVNVQLLFLSQTTSASMEGFYNILHCLVIIDQSWTAGNDAIQAQQPPGCVSFRLRFLLANEDTECSKPIRNKCAVAYCLMPFPPSLKQMSHHVIHD